MGAVELSIEGMTCASCATRIEKKLNKVDGVVATVNYATATASVAAAAGVSTAELVRVVEATGYHAQTKEPAAPDHDPNGDAETRQLRRRLVVSGALAVPRDAAVDGPRAARPRVALGRARARPAGRHVGSVAVPPGRPGRTPATAPRPWTPWSRSASSWPRPGRSVGVVSRCGEPTSRSRPWSPSSCSPAGTPRRAPGAGSGAALRALLGLGAKDAGRAAPDGVEERVPVGELAVGDLFVVRPGETVATDGVVVDGTSARSTRRCSPASRCRSRSGRATDGRRRHGERRRPARRCAPPGSAPTPSSPRWPGWSSRRRAARPPVQRLADRVSAVFVPRGARGRGADAASGWLLAGAARRPTRCTGRGRRAGHRLPVRARASRPRRRCSSAPAAARSSAS